MISRDTKEEDENHPMRDSETEATKTESAHTSERTKTKEEDANHPIRDPETEATKTESAHTSERTKTKEEDENHPIRDPETEATKTESARTKMRVCLPCESTSCQISPTPQLRRISIFRHMYTLETCRVWALGSPPEWRLRAREEWAIRTAQAATRCIPRRLVNTNFLHNPRSQSERSAVAVGLWRRGTERAEFVAFVGAALRAMAQIASVEAVVAARLPSAAVASTSASRHTVVAGASLRGQNVYNFGSLSSSRSLAFGGKKAKIESAQQRRAPAVSATIAAPEILQSSVDIPKLAEELGSASPLEIMDRALSMYGDDIAIAFSGAEDVALIEYAHLTGRPFRVFSLETGRLNPETLRLFAEVEKRYNIHIQYMFPDATEVEELVRAKGLFSFYEDGHQECCRVRKVRPLRRALRGLRAWITGQRKDQSPGTRANVPVMQVDPAFEGVDGGPGSLVKWNPLANVSGTAVWSFLRTMDVPVNALHFQGYVSIGCEPCTRAVLPGQHEREGRWWWEDAKAKECGLHKGNIEGLTEPQSALGEKVEAADLFTGENVKTFARDDMEALAKGENREKSTIAVLYAPWCSFSQAMNDSYNAFADKLAGSNVVVGKFNADGAQKVYAKENLQLKSYPTVLFFPKNSTQIIKYPSENREVDALLGFVEALQ